MTVEDVARILSDGPMTAPEIARALDRERSGIYKHLYTLEAAGIVAREPVGQRARWILAEQEIPANWGRGGMDHRTLSPRAKRILGLLCYRPMTAPEIARRMDASRASVHRSLRRLEDAGLIRSAGFDTARRRRVVRWELVA